MRRRPGMLDTKRLCREFVEAGVPAAEAAAAASLCRGAAALEISPAAPMERPVGASLFGGAPDLPPGFVWPRRKNRRFLSFVAQINLAECAAYMEPIWPRDGLLLLFYDALEAPMGDSLHHFDACAVRYLDAEAVKRMPRERTPRPRRPTPLPVLPSGLMTLRPEVSWPTASEVRDHAEGPRSNSDAYYNLRYNEKDKKVTSQFGGHSVELQTGGALGAALYWSGIEEHRLPSRHPLHNHLESEEWMAYERSWRLVAQFDGLTLRFGNFWKYGGDRLYFWAREDCIRSRSFDQVWFTMDID